MVRWGSSAEAGYKTAESWVSIRLCYSESKFEIQVFIEIQFLRLSDRAFRPRSAHNLQLEHSHSLGRL